MEKNLLKRWQSRVFILCWIAYACIYFGRVNLSVAIPYIQEAFQLNKGQVGLIGSLFFWIYGIGQLINGYIGDKVSSKLFIFIGLLVTALANIFFGLTSAFAFMLLFWAVNGYFQSILWGPVAKTLSLWYPYEKQSGIIIAISTSMVGGYMLSWGLSGQILSRMNWRWVFLIPGMVIFAFSFIWFLGVKNRPEDVGLESPNIHIKSQLEKSDKTEYISMSLWSVICKTKLWFVVIACFAQGIIKEGIGLWAPSFIMETQNLDIKSATSLILFIPIMNFFGMMMAGWLNKKFKYQEKLTTITLFALGIIMIIGLINFGKLGVGAALIFLGLSSAAMYGANTMLLGVIPMSFAKYNKVSSVAGFLDFCSYLASGFAAFITGIIVKNYGWYSVMSLWAAIAIVGIISLIASLRSDRNVTKIL